MFSKLKLSNFRRHEDLTVDFTKGLQVVRAANEGGKSTLIEAALYALYGSSALRQSLEETVTWGHEPKTLRVVLDLLDQSGQAYTFTRSKAGAEVSKDGVVFVTGHKEVSAFAATVMGADAKVAANLMLSGQNGLRGVLEEGPKATAQTIENLANFELFDKILEAAAEKLTLGTVVPLETRRQMLTSQLNDLPTTEAPDQAVLDSALLHLQSQMDLRTTMIKDSLQPKLDLAVAAWRNAHAVREQAAALGRDLAQVQAMIETTKADIAAVQALADSPLPDVESLEAKLAQAKAHADILGKWQTFSALPVVKKGVDRVQWEADVASTEKEKAAAQAAIATARGDIRVLQTKKITETACGLCGKDLSDVPEVVEKNRKLDEQIDLLTVKVAELEEQLVGFTQALSLVPKVREVDEKVRNLAQSLGNFVTVDMSQIPAVVTWSGPAVDSEVPDLKAISAEVANAKDSQKRILAAIAQREAYQSTLAAVNQREISLQKQREDLAPLSDEAFNALEAEYLAAAQAVEMTAADISKLQEEADQAKVTFASALQVHETAARNRQVLADQIAQIDKDIVEVEFNNVLVKKIRAARPIVANKLWNIVLASVSQLFSRMRGEQSIVTRGADGFLVNGKGIEGLSGSTLDILGLAVRTALVRTFVPGCSMMVLDEPAAACDSSRATSLLGFIASSGFDQTILITHEEVSESFANNLIQL